MSTYSNSYPGTVRNRREDVNDTEPWLQKFFCFGHCDLITKFLEEKTGRQWLIVKFINALLRGIGQVVFANNPFSGLLILVGLFWHSLIVGYIVLISTSIAIFTAAIFQQYPKDISSGSVSFNAVLLSSVTTSLWTPLYEQPIGYDLWLFILIGSSLSVIISNGLTNILSSFKPTLPILSIPFHILVFAIFASLKPYREVLTDDMKGNFIVESINETFTTNTPLYNHLPMISPTEESLQDIEILKNTEMYSWDSLRNIFFAVIYSSSQVFGIANMITGILIYSGMLLYSPLLTVLCFFGAILGTVLGFCLTSFPNDEVFLGIWGFNGLLSCGAIGLFYVVNFYSVLNAIFCAIFTAIVQLCLTSHFSINRMPVFGLPFVLSTILFISATSKGDQLVRISVTTYPEHHRRIHKVETSQNNGNRQLLSV